MAMKPKRPKWYEKFTDIIEECWEHHGPCMHLNINTFYDRETKEWLILCAPVFQEVLGGADDGKIVWQGFIFHSDAFSRSEGVYVENFAAGSLCKECSPGPKVMFKGKYRGHKFHLQVMLEPPADSGVVEVIDTINKQILCKKGMNANGDDDHGTGTQPHQGGDADQKPGEGHPPGVSGETPAD